MKLRPQADYNVTMYHFTGIIKHVIGRPRIRRIGPLKLYEEPRYQSLETSGSNEFGSRVLSPAPFHLRFRSSRFLNQLLLRHFSGAIAKNLDCVK
jgi:hypothetical protein